MAGASCVHHALMKNVQPKPLLLRLLRKAGATAEVFSMREVMHYLGQYITLKQLYDKKQQHIVHCGSDALGKLFRTKWFSIKDPVQLSEMLARNLTLWRVPQTAHTRTSVPTAKDRQPGRDGHLKDRQPGRDGHLKDRQPGRDGHLKDRQPGRDGHLKGRQPGRDGQLKGRQPGRDGHPKGRQPGRDEHPKGRQPGRDGHPKGQQPGRDGHLKGRQPGRDGHLKGRQPGRDGHLKGRQPGRDGHLKGRQPGRDGHLKGRQPGKPNEEAIASKVPDSAVSNLKRNISEADANPEHRPKRQAVSGQRDVAGLPLRSVIYSQSRQIGSTGIRNNQDIDTVVSNSAKKIKRDNNSTQANAEIKQGAIHPKERDQEKEKDKNTAHKEVIEGTIYKAGDLICPKITRSTSGPPIAVEEPYDGIDVPDSRRSVKTPNSKSRPTPCGSSQSLDMFSQPSTSGLQRNKKELQCTGEEAKTVKGQYEDDLQSQSKILGPCLICGVHPRTGNIIHRTMGHLVACFTCARILLKRKLSCPICEQPIITVIQTYIE